MIDNFIEKLSKQYAQGLPGREHQVRMAVLARKSTMEAPPTARRACVMILLFQKDGEWHVLLTERTSSDNPNHNHSGQISFPGGQLEEKDESLEACALRETFEEVGIPPNTIQIIGEMTDLYIPVSNFHVFPFLGWTSDPPQYQRQETEVKHIIETPLSILLNSENLKFKDIHINDSFVLRDVPYFDVFGKAVWGATAMMLSEMLELLKEQ
jgi:8-oxo-dGTP pyrophosphatase MutT (NUDIX family)